MEMSGWPHGEIKVDVVGIKRNGKRCLSDYSIPDQKEIEHDLKLEKEAERRLDAIAERVSGADDPPSDNDDEDEDEEFEEDNLRDSD
jgi:hypothetical protein